MLKVSALVILALCFSVSIFAQSKGETQFGFTAGLNGTSVSASNLDMKLYPGLNAGLTGEHYFSNRWSVLTRLLFDQKGWSDGTVYTNFSFTRTNYRLNYFTMPVLANFHFGAKRNWFFNVGPYASWLLSAKTTANGNDVKYQFNNFDAGVELGVGIKFPVNNKHNFVIEFKGQGGITDINRIKFLLVDENGSLINENNFVGGIATTLGALNLGFTF